MTSGEHKGSFHGPQSFMIYIKEGEYAAMIFGLCNGMYRMCRNLANGV